MPNFNDIVPFVTPEMYGAVGNGLVNDTVALNLASTEAVRLSKQLKLGSAYLVSQWVIPNGLNVHGTTSKYNTESTSRPTKIIQINGQTVPAVIAQNVLYSDKTGAIVMHNIRVQSNLNNSTGLYFENLSNCEFGNICVSGFNRGFTFKQVHDSTVTGQFLSLNCTHAGEFISGVEDNTNNIIVDFMVCEAFTESGLTIEGGDEGNGSVNKLSFNRLKIESGLLTNTATHAFKMHNASTISFLNFDVTVVGNAPNSSFKMFDVDNCNSINFGLIELREQTSTPLISLGNVSNSNGMRMTLVSALFVDTVNELIVFDNDTCENIDFLYLQDRNGIGSTPSNLNATCSLNRSKPDQFNTDIELTNGLRFTNNGVTYNFNIVDGAIVIT